MPKKIGFITAVLFVLFGLGILSAHIAHIFDNVDFSELFGRITSGDEDSKFSEEEEVKKESIPRPDQITLSTMFFGDVYFGRYVDDWSQASELKYAYPFSGLETFGRENYDAWIANLECPVTTTYRSAAQQNANLMFSCQPEYIPEARKWFDVFSLANNHTDNMEHVDGFQQTKDFLEESDFQYFGHYQNSNSEEVCEVVSLTTPSASLLIEEGGEEEGVGGGSLKQEWFDNDDDYQTYLNLLEKTDEEIAEGYEGELMRDFHIPIALCGFHGVFELPTDEDLAVIEEYARYLPTFIMPHQGVEYKFKANAYQENIYRKMIDLGADAVIGGHTHTVQNTEVYQGELIVYSLGNFIFDQKTKYKTEGMALSMKLTFDYDENFIEWLKISESCSIAEDDCLAQAKNLSLKKPRFTIEYDAVGTDNSSHVVQRASESVETTILERANWESTVVEYLGF